MKSLLILFFIFPIIITYAVPKDTIGVVRKKEVYMLIDNCKDSIQWEEVILKDSIIQNKINIEVRSLIQSFKADSIYYESICNEALLDESNSTIKYSKNNLISIFFKQHYIYPSIESSINIRTLNYSIRTGKVIAFHELFKTEKLHTIDSIIIDEMKNWYADFEMTFGSDELVNTQEQIINAQFIIEDTRIVLYLRGTHCPYCSDEDPEVFFDYTEYKNYFNKRGVLKALLKTK